MSIHDVSVQRIVADTKEGKAFADLVTEDVKGTITDDDALMLRRPENLDEFYGCLVEMLRSFEIQLARQKIKSLQARQEAIAHNAIATWEVDHLKVLEWRRVMNNLRRHVETRMREIRTLRRSLVTAEAMPDVLHAADLLVQAVIRHRELAPDASEEELEAIDQQLWDVLEDPLIGKLVDRLRQLPSP